MMAVLESTELLNDVKALQKPTDGIFPSDDNDGSDSVLKQVSATERLSLHGLKS